ncbi:hypothetical protein U1Q18_014297 [Sarracenia purpurea var. burkii]
MSQLPWYLDFEYPDFEYQVFAMNLVVEILPHLKFPGTVIVRLTASGLAPADCCLCRSSSWPQYSCVLGSYVKPIADRRVAAKHSAVDVEQRIQDHDYVKKPIAKESLEDEELKAAFEKWMYKGKPVRNYYFVKT